MNAPVIYPFFRGFLSQHHPSNFVSDGVEYTHAEQKMMHAKALLFEDGDMASRIMKATSPKDQQRLGQQVRNFDQTVWNSKRISIVTEANRSKFQQNDGLRKKLLRTGDAILAEANPRDMIWGIGLDEHDERVHNPAEWLGENLLGQVLMQVRSELSCASSVML